MLYLLKNVIVKSRLVTGKTSELLSELSFWGQASTGIELEDKGMVSQKVVIKNPTGLHLRPAGILCKEAMQFKSLITFTFRDNTANAKSVLSVLGACVKCGDEVEFVCDGEDEESVNNAICLARCVSTGFSF